MIELLPATPSGPGTALTLLLIGGTLRASLLVVLALCAAVTLRRASASVRHLVWCSALAGALILPLASLVLPRWNVAVLPELTSSQKLSLEGSPFAAGLVEPEARAGYTRTLPLHARTSYNSVLFVLIWGSGALLLLARLLHGAARIAGFARRASVVDDAEWLQLMDALRARVGVRAHVRVLRARHECVPMTWGVRNPVVLLPASSVTWPHARRRVVLMHELAHIRRGDALVQWVAHLAHVVHWFNPLVWLAARCLRDERERACDDFVLAGGALPVEYAEHLLQLVSSVGQNEGPMTALAMARRSQFEGRVVAILDDRLRRSSAGWKAALVIALIALCAVPALAALTPARRVHTDAAVRQEPVRVYAQRYGIGEDLAAAIVRAAQEERIETDLAFKLVRAESNFRERAVGPRGSIGLTQILLSTAATMRAGLTREELFARDTNLRLGLRYLRRMLNTNGGDVRMALASYSMGPRQALSIKASGGDPTRPYADQVLGRPEMPTTPAQSAEPPQPPAPLSPLLPPSPLSPESPSAPVSRPAPVSPPAPPAPPAPDLDGQAS